MLNVKWPLIQCKCGQTLFSTICRAARNYKSILFSGAIVKSLEIFFLAQGVSKISIAWSTPTRWLAPPQHAVFVGNNPTELNGPNIPMPQTTIA